MKVKTTVILFGVFVILLLFVYLFEGPLSEKSRKKSAEAPYLFPAFDKAVAAKIEVKGPARTVTLEKNEEGWLIAETDGFSADPQAVNNALTTIAGFVGDTIASKNPEKQDIFEVTPAKGTEVKVSALDRTILAHFYLGKTAADFFSTYLRREGSDKVLQVGSVTSIFDKTIKDWRDKTILAFSPDTLTQLTLKTVDAEISMERDEKGEWRITRPVNAPAQKEVLATMVKILSSLQALDFAEGYDLTPYGLDLPRLTATLILRDQEEKRLLIGKMDEEKSQYYAKNQAKKTIFLIGRYQFDTLNKTLEDIREKEEADKPATAEEESGSSIVPGEGEQPAQKDG